MDSEDWFIGNMSEKMSSQKKPRPKRSEGRIRKINISKLESNVRSSNPENQSKSKTLKRSSRREACMRRRLLRALEEKEVYRKYYPRTTKRRSSSRPSDRSDHFEPVVMLQRCVKSMTVQDFPLNNEDGSCVCPVTFGPVEGMLHTRRLRCPGHNTHCIQFHDSFITPADFLLLGNCTDPSKWRNKIHVKGLLSLDHYLRTDALWFWDHETYCTGHCVAFLKQKRKMENGQTFTGSGKHRGVLVDNGQRSTESEKHLRVDRVTRSSHGMKVSDDQQRIASGQYTGGRRNEEQDWTKEQPNFEVQMLHHFNWKPMEDSGWVIEYEIAEEDLFLSDGSCEDVQDARHDIAPDAMVDPLSLTPVTSIFPKDFWGHKRTSGHLITDSDPPRKRKASTKRKTEKPRHTEITEGDSELKISSCFSLQGMDQDGVGNGVVGVEGITDIHGITGVQDVHGQSSELSEAHAALPFDPVVYRGVEAVSIENDYNDASDVDSEGTKTDDSIPYPVSLASFQGVPGGVLPFNCMSEPDDVVSLHKGNLSDLHPMLLFKNEYGSLTAEDGLVEPSEDRQTLPGKNPRKRSLKRHVYDDAESTLLNRNQRKQSESRLHRTAHRHVVKNLDSSSSQQDLGNIAFIHQPMVDLGQPMVSLGHYPVISGNHPFVNASLMSASAPCQPVVIPSVYSNLKLSPPSHQTQPSSFPTTQHGGNENNKATQALPTTAAPAISSSGGPYSNAKATSKSPPKLTQNMSLSPCSNKASKDLPLSAQHLTPSCAVHCSKPLMDTSASHPTGSGLHYIKMGIGNLAAVERGTESSSNIEPKEARAVSCLTTAQTQATPSLSVDSLPTPTEPGSIHTVFSSLLNSKYPVYLSFTAKNSSPADTTGTFKNVILPINNIKDAQLLSVYPTEVLKFVSHHLGVPVFNLQVARQAEKPNTDNSRILGQKIYVPANQLAHPPSSKPAPQPSIQLVSQSSIQLPSQSSIQLSSQASIWSQSLSIEPSAHASICSTSQPSVNSASHQIMLQMPSGENHIVETSKVPISKPCIWSILKQSPSIKTSAHASICSTSQSSVNSASQEMMLQTPSGQNHVLETSKVPSNPNHIPATDSVAPTPTPAGVDKKCNSQLPKKGLHLPGVGNVMGFRLPNGQIHLILQTPQTKDKASPLPKVLPISSDQTISMLPFTSQTALQIPVLSALTRSPSSVIPQTALPIPVLSALTRPPSSVIPQTALPIPVLSALTTSASSARPRTALPVPVLSALTTSASSARPPTALPVPDLSPLTTSASSARLQTIKITKGNVAVIYDSLTSSSNYQARQLPKDVPLNSDILPNTPAFVSNQSIAATTDTLKLSSSSLAPCEAGYAESKTQNPANTEAKVVSSRAATTAKTAMAGKVVKLNMTGSAQPAVQPDQVSSDSDSQLNLSVSAARVDLTTDHSYRKNLPNSSTDSITVTEPPKHSTNSAETTKSEKKREKDGLDEDSSLNKETEEVEVETVRACSGNNSNKRIVGDEIGAAVTAIKKDIASMADKSETPTDRKIVSVGITKSEMKITTDIRDTPAEKSKTPIRTEKSESDIATDTKESNVTTDESETAMEVDENESAVTVDLTGTDSVVTERMETANTTDDKSEADIVTGMAKTATTEKNKTDDIATPKDKTTFTIDSNETYSVQITVDKDMAVISVTNDGTEESKMDSVTDKTEVEIVPEGDVRTDQTTTNVTTGNKKTGISSGKKTATSGRTALADRDSRETAHASTGSAPSSKTESGNYVLTDVDSWQEMNDFISLEAQELSSALASSPRTLEQDKNKAKKSGSHKLSFGFCNQCNTEANLIGYTKSHPNVSFPVYAWLDDVKDQQTEVTAPWEEKSLCKHYTNVIASLRKNYPNIQPISLVQQDGGTDSLPDLTNYSGSLFTWGRRINNVKDSQGRPVYLKFIWTKLVIQTPDKNFKCFRQVSFHHQTFCLKRVKAFTANTGIILDCADLLFEIRNLEPLSHGAQGVDSSDKMGAAVETERIIDVWDYEGKERLRQFLTQAAEGDEGGNMMEKRQSGRTFPADVLDQTLKVWYEDETTSILIVSSKPLKLKDFNSAENTEQFRRAVSMTEDFDFEAL